MIQYIKGLLGLTDEPPYGPNWQYEGEVSTVEIADERDAAIEVREHVHRSYRNVETGEGYRGDGRELSCTWYYFVDLDEWPAAVRMVYASEGRLSIDAIAEEWGPTEIEVTLEKPEDMDDEDEDEEEGDAA